MSRMCPLTTLSKVNFLQHILSKKSLTATWVQFLCIRAGDWGPDFFLKYAKDLC